MVSPFCAGGESGWSSEDPAWLALLAVHYAMLPGNQQPCFRVALGHGDTRAWLAWEVTPQFSPAGPASIHVM